MSLQNGRQILLYELCVWNTEKAMQEQGKPVSFTVYHLQSLGLVVMMILPVWFDNVDRSFASKKFSLLVLPFCETQLFCPPVENANETRRMLLLHVGGKCGSANSYPKWKSFTSRKRRAIARWRRGGKIGESTSCGKNSGLLNIHSIVHSLFIAASLATSISSSLVIIYLVIIYLSSTQYKPLPSDHRL